MRKEDVERLYASHARALFRFLAYRVDDERLVEDVLSEVFERAVRAPRLRRREEAAEKAWLYQTATNCLRDQLRRRAAERRALDRVAEHGRLSEYISFDERVQDRAVVATALRRLTDAEREALALRYGASLTVPEIAAVIGESLTTTEGRVYRALRKLREILSD